VRFGVACGTSETFGGGEIAVEIVTWEEGPLDDGVTITMGDWSDDTWECHGEEMLALDATTGAQGLVDLGGSSGGVFKSVRSNQLMKVFAMA